MKKIFLAFSLVLFSYKSLWAFWPVIDFNAIVQMIKIYQTNKQILDNGISQLVNAKNQLVSMTSPSYYANMFNSPSEIEARLYTAQTWQDALNGKSQGDNAAYQQLLQGYETFHPAIQPEAYRMTHTENQYKQFDEHQKTVKTVAATSQNEYGNTNKYIQNITALGKEASSKSNNGVKTAVDLNTRMTEQVGYLIASNIRLQAVNNNLTSSNEQQDLDKQKVADDFFATNE